MSLIIEDPQKEINKAVSFLKQTFAQQKIGHAVIAVSGGIDSALVVTLLAKALPITSIHPVLLPYYDQSITDAEAILEWNKIPKNQWATIDIGPMVDTAIRQLDIPADEVVRRGNVMARTRMIINYDLAKKLPGMVVGTENKSEHYLGYFTRFGDAASDIEPIAHLYKTQVRQLAGFLKMPKSILEKAPSAGLWEGQTDEGQMGFSYELADRVMEQYVDRKKRAGDIRIDGASTEDVKRVVDTIEGQAFKREVPYKPKYMKLESPQKKLTY